MHTDTGETIELGDPENMKQYCSRRRIDIPQYVAYPREETGWRVRPDFDEEGSPMYLSPRFYSTLVVDTPLGRYRAAEYSATFDDTRPI
jgi:hypothetical protein